MNGLYKIIPIATMAITLFFTSGCASTFLRKVTKAEGLQSHGPYPSVRMAGESLKHPSKLTPLILLDLPLSAALDTAMLPFDAAKSRRPSRRPKIGQSVPAAPLTKEESAKVIEVAIRKRIKKPVGELTEADLEKMTSLNLRVDQLTDVRSLKKLTKLKHLDLEENKLSSVNGLEDLKQLTQLYLSSNQLTDVKGLENLTQLKTLHLINNQLTDVKGLENLTKLTDLKLSNNKLTSVKGLEDLKQLTGLHLSNNQLSDVKGLELLTQLIFLYLNDNPNLTKAQIDELKKALPKCRIFSDFE